MEAYTNMTIEMENYEIAIKAAEIAIAAIKKDNAYKNDEHNVSRFINDINVNEGTITVNDSCTLDSWEFDQLIPLMIKAIAATDEVKTFNARTEYLSCNCGYEAYCDADYGKGTLTIESCASESFYGDCDECGEFEIYYKDYDPNKSYICEDCGKVLTEEDLFPYGVPEVVIEHFEI